MVLLKVMAELSRSLGRKVSGASFGLLAWIAREAALMNWARE